ncbi:(S)-benzoin forming benzil reductase [Tenacibaculum sp. 1_MG-2023]|uniref:(S)-benzoin forming benzil reductase n=1 Tax=Tenacibaculum sp. 1_MG-2023 TaxID=3062653 RepID=UPI0026E1BE83|nr:(S)-benzoin forming benzil reductase [Tenacibaculum sp. 1_MG-2023]MDO6601004.1 (S)-benzoin forming benzil reductase [Tenacibaculum sp. 1_MG-2023]
MNTIIITGGSKGIGKALAKKYATENYKVYSLSRSIVDLQNVTQISVDLSNLQETTKTFKMLFEEIQKQEISSITLVNNAGRLGTISNLENIDAEDIAKTMQLNTTTPLILSSLFIKLSENIKGKRQIINISSGAAQNSYEGWSIYCTSKAAIDMMTKTIAAEQNEIKNGVKCVSIYPGVVDTNMQTHIRKTDKTDFKNLDRFIELKENNQLFTPDFVAETIFKVDIENTLNSGDIVDIRSF